MSSFRGHGFRGPTAFDGPLQAEARRHPNLAAYNRRMLERFFPEWAEARAA